MIARVIGEPCAASRIPSPARPSCAALGLGVLLGVLLGAVSACGPEAPRRDAQRYAESYCAAILQCDCAPRWDDAAACEHDVLTRMEAVLDQDGVAVDRECFDRALEAIADHPCALAPLQTGEPPPPICLPIVSDRELGEPCAEAAVPGLPYPPCAEGLHCTNVGHVCASLTTPLLGKQTEDSCDPTLDWACNLEDYCTLDGVCRPEQPEGEPCSDFGCKPGLYCAGAHSTGEGLCAPQLAEGDPCDAYDYLACGYELQCSYTTGRCEPPNACSILASFPLLWR
ncbi:MAG: hypothetical protein IPH07_22630 [Deltaproteobacteria bacterium]|nr:hypothetical protein [Deltaproteobacteria bacterium]MBK8714227.1 hypothetical protein [Deltaproteobacteria bacterium]MBP7285983.1 hypothetical protein [Nannocystaceae bacterium]